MSNNILNILEMIAVISLVVLFTFDIIQLQLPIVDENTESELLLSNDPDMDLIENEQIDGDIINNTVDGIINSSVNNPSLSLDSDAESSPADTSSENEVTTSDEFLQKLGNGGRSKVEPPIIPGG